MAEYKTVAIAGASGTLGPHVVKALAEANMDVTVLTRTTQPGAYDSSVKVIEVDYSSTESLTAALQGIDAVVSTVGGPAFLAQKTIIDAAIIAGVRRFIPSDFGTVTTSPLVHDLPFYAPQHEIRSYLKDKAANSNLSWSILRCGAFLEYLQGKNPILDLVDHTGQLFDQGDNRFSSTSLVEVGKAIAAILKRPHDTENKILKISQTILTQNRIIKIAEEVRPDITWQTTMIPAAQVLQAGLDGITAGDRSFGTTIKIIQGTTFGGEKYGGALDDNDNVLLGVKELTSEELKELIAERLA